MKRAIKSQISEHFAALGRRPRRAQRMTPQAVEQRRAAGRRSAAARHRRSSGEAAAAAAGLAQSTGSGNASSNPGVN